MPQLPAGILSEHQAPIDQSPPGYNPSEGEQSAIRLVEKLFSESKRTKSNYDQKWLEHYKFFRGKQWPERRPSYRHSEVLNYIYSEVSNVVVLLTDKRPTIEVLPEDPTDYDFAEILNSVVKFNWDSKNFSYTLAECITDSAIYGTSIASVPWKPELADGLGDYTFESEDVFYCFPDPNAKSKINDEYCDYFITARPVDVKKLKAKYPDKADFLSPDIGDLYSDTKEGLDEIRYKSPSDNRVLIDTGNTPRPGRPNQVLELCAYLKSEEMIEEKVGEETDEATGLPKDLFQSKKKYPNGRKLVIANQVLLEDGPNPYDDGKFPYARLVDNALPREFWGVGEVEQLKSPQQIVNKIVSYLLDYMTIMGNPIWVVDTNSGIDTDNLTNQPGLTVEKNPGTEARRESGVALPSYIMDALQFMANNVLQKLSPTGEVSKGVAPSDNSSGYAIQQLQDAAETKIRGKARNIEVFLKEVGDLMVARVLQSYTVPRIIRLTSNEESAKFFKFAISETEDSTGEVTKIAEVEDYAVDPLTQQYVSMGVRQIPIKSKLDVRVNVGSSLPFARAENKAQAEKLFDKHIIDTEEYLTQIEYPHKERVLERLRKQAQMQAAMPPAPQPGAPNAGPGPSGTPIVA